jgi:hypothetical protein
LTKVQSQKNSKLLKEIEKECTDLLLNKKGTKKKNSNSYYPNLDDPDFASKLSEFMNIILYKVEKYNNIKSQKEYYRKIK